MIFIISFSQVLVHNNYRYWNDSARLNQRQHGYEYTKLYKAISMEKSPFQYFSVRMWARSEDEEHFLKYSKFNTYYELNYSKFIFVLNLMNASSKLDFDIDRTDFYFSISFQI